MVKLAEARTKQRYTLVPRGKALYEDGERFGTKMLEKMGWSEGKGLGANEDGSKDFVRLRYKNDIKGLGYEARDDQWTQHENNFNGLLKNLNGEKTEQGDDSDVDMRSTGLGFSQTASKEKTAALKVKLSGESLEEKSKRSRARVHYKKFTRGKDLTQYNEKDLANIFGKKTLEENSESTLQENDNLIKENKLNEQIFQNSKLSVEDYFKEKMKARKEQRAQANGDKLYYCYENSEHKRKHIEDVGEEATNNDLESFEKPKKKKKKRKDGDLNGEVVEMKEEENVEIIMEDKKIKNKNKKNNPEEIIVNNDSINETSEEVQVKAKDLSEKDSKKSKKEKKRKHKECADAELISEEVQKSSEMEFEVSTEAEPKKSKKEKKKNKQCAETEYIIKEKSEKSSDMEGNASIEPELKKSKKEKNKMEEIESNKEKCTTIDNELVKVKKKKKKSYKDFEIEDKIEITENNNTDETNVNKKKKEKNLNIAENVDEVAVKELNVHKMEENYVEESTQDNSCKEKFKQKKKKNVNEEAVKEIEEHKTVESIGNNSSNEKTKKKKKKSENKEKSHAVENIQEEDTEKDEQFEKV